LLRRSFLSRGEARHGHRPLSFSATAAGTVRSFFWVATYAPHFTQPRPGDARVSAAQSDPPGPGADLTCDIFRLHEPEIGAEGEQVQAFFPFVHALVAESAIVRTVAKGGDAKGAVTRKVAALGGT
jgi:hypothetical protein